MNTIGGREFRFVLLLIRADLTRLALLRSFSIFFRISYCYCCYSGERWPERSTPTSGNPAVWVMHTGRLIVTLANWSDPPNVGVVLNLQLVSAPLHWLKLGTDENPGRGEFLTCTMEQSFSGTRSIDRAGGVVLVRWWVDGFGGEFCEVLGSEELAFI